MEFRNMVTITLIYLDYQSMVVEQLLYYSLRSLQTKEHGLWSQMIMCQFLACPPSSPSHPSGSSQCTSPEHVVSCIKRGLVIRFTYDNIHISMPFSQIIPLSPSPTASKRLFYTSVFLLLSHIQDYHNHLSKFHIYALVYCVDVFLSGLLQSV